MITTTAGNETQILIDKAMNLSSKLGIEYHPRRGKSLKYLLANIDSQIFVVNNMRGLSYYDSDSDEAFYHPNMAFLRLINLKNGHPDSMAEACKLESGMSFFDGTLGLAADSVTASWIVGENGRITATEKSFPVYVLVKEGLSFYAEQNPELASVIERINIKNLDNLDFLRKCEDSGYDVVYFDFMFNKPLETSNGIRVIDNLASRDVITIEHICEACRVAKKRVVVKSDGGGLRTLAEFGFAIEKENQRKKFYYAVLEK